MKRLLLDGPELRRDIPPAPVTRAEPVVRLRSGLTLDDRSCWQYPTMLVGSVGSGKSTLLDQIQQPVLAHAAKAGDAENMDFPSLRPKKANSPPCRTTFGWTNRRIVQTGHLWCARTWMKRSHRL